MNLDRIPEVLDEIDPRRFGRYAFEIADALKNGTEDFRPVGPNGRYGMNRRDPSKSTKIGKYCEAHPEIERVLSGESNKLKASRWRLKE